MSSHVRAWIAGLLIGVLGAVFSVIPSGTGLEQDIGLDLLFTTRGVRPPPPDIVIVTMDKISAENLGVPADPDKWPRSLHADLTSSLKDRKAAVIAFDIMFDDVRSEKDNLLFAEAIRDAGNVILCECLRKETVALSDEKGSHGRSLNIEKVVSPIPVLAEAALALAPFPLPKVPVKVSQFWTFKTAAGDKPTLPVVALQTFSLDQYDEFFRMLERNSAYAAETLPSNKGPLLSSQNVDVLVRDLRDIFRKEPWLAGKMRKDLDGKTASVDDKKGRTLRSLIKMYEGPNSHYLNFYGPPGTIPTISYYKALSEKNESSGSRNEWDVAGKAVFVGLSEHLRPEQKDGFHTVFSQSSGMDISGVEVAATAFGNLLEDKPVRPVGPVSHIAVVLCWGLLLGFLCIFLPALAAAGSVLGLGILYFFFSQHQFSHSAVWHPLVVPLFIQAPVAFFGTVLWKYFRTAKERENIRRAFGLYLPDQLVDQLSDDLSGITTNSRELYGTCLYTDAGQYTAVSERVSARKLDHIMAEYYETLFEPVRHHGGTIINIVGDSMLAVWTTENPDALLQRQASLAALQSAKAIDHFNRTHPRYELPTRFGLHSGQIVLGPVGAADHYEFRPTGDTVNTAARMEGLNKYLGTRILATGNVVVQLEEVLARELGTFFLVGKAKPVVVYELLCRVDESDERQFRLCEVFARGLAAYQNRSWEVAIERFQESLKIHREDGPSSFYLNICLNLSANPPDDSWDGSIHMEKK